MATKVEIEFRKHPSGGYLVNPFDLQANIEENGRRTTAIDPQFVASIAQGQDTPCKVRPVTVEKGAKTWKLVFGFRRWLAAKQIRESGLNPDFLLWVVVDETLNDEQSFLANIRENRDRKSTTILDDAINIGRLKEVYGKTQEDIAKEYGKTGAWVSKTVKLLQLDSKWHDLIDAQQLTAAQAEKLVDCEEDFRNQLYEQIKADGFCKFSSNDINQKAREAGAKRADGNATRSTKQIMAFVDGLIEPDEADADAVSEPMREFAKCMKKWLRGQRQDKWFMSELDMRLRSMKQLNNAAPTTVTDAVAAD